MFTFPCRPWIGPSRNGAVLSLPALDARSSWLFAVHDQIDALQRNDEMDYKPT